MAGVSVADVERNIEKALLGFDFDRLFKRALGLSASTLTKYDASKHSVTIRADT